MLNWIPIVFGSYFLFAVSNIFDKVLRSNFVKNSFTLVILNGSISFVIGAILVLSRPIILAAPNLPLIVISGALSTIAAMVYFIALSKSEVSRIIPILISVLPIFVLILGYAFLGEALTQFQFLAFILIVSGGVVISIQKVKGAFKLTMSFWLMLLSAFLYAVSTVILKYGLQSSNFYTTQAIFQIGAFVGALLILAYCIATKRIKLRMLAYRPKAVIIASANQVIYFSGRLIYNVALTIAPVALVVSFGGFQGLYILALTVLLSLYFSGILKEEIKRDIILVKLSALGLMIVGVAILAYM